MNVEYARTQMLEQQVRAWDVLDPRVLEALAGVPREEFVPPRYRGLAFADTAIPLGHGESMMTPKVEGRLLQALELDGSERVLEVGTGSGFLAACLARLGASVTTLEIHAGLAYGAGETLSRLAVSNVQVEVGDVFQRTFDTAYDAIAVTGSLPVYDPVFEQWLAPGGRLFVIAGRAPVMDALLVRRVGEHEFGRTSLFETVVPPLRNARAPSSFEW
jgi:protein-L-isoaspartate(D-aspartate) O-methyltransferase